MTQRIEAVVRGGVQGVGYRLFVLLHARRLALSGHVGNLPDGTVEVEAEGDLDGLLELVARLREGPPSATVATLDVAWSETTGVSGEFGVRS